MTRGVWVQCVSLCGFGQFVLGCVPSYQPSLSSPQGTESTGEVQVVGGDSLEKLRGKVSVMLTLTGHVISHVISQHHLLSYHPIVCSSGGGKSP